SEERKLIIGLGALCNNSEKNSRGQFVGMPTEIAITKAFAEENDEFQRQFPRIGEIPFTSLRKLMTTVHKSGETYLVVTKGAPDYLIKKCTHVMHRGNVSELTSNFRSKLEQLNKDMADKSLRVLAVAKKEVDSVEKSDEELECGLTFCGLIGIEDPPRKEAKKAVAMCKKAGIIPVMITGDQMPTALAIAKRLGIYEDGSKAMSSQQLADCSGEELSKIIYQYRVFARVSPEDKVKIVRAFQKNHAAIAMTGDGINDAPALKAADIGCAMGKNGTEVAKSAADMVLTDDNFATIVEAVKEGRGIYANIRKTIHFLLSCNMGEILLVFSAFLLGLPIPLLATQILWVNLVTDSFPALALGAGSADENIMEGKFKENEKVIYGMEAHHGDCEPKTIEAILVQVADAISASRPGARRETVDTYIKRLQKLEEICN
ncbi:MAG: HAD-IC family P-type ATPase, partial [Oscillospiraceae bacterium]